MRKDWEDIKVSRRGVGKKYFESTLLQNISDGIDYLRDEADVILNELDSTEFKQQIDEIDFKEFSEDILIQIDDVVVDLSNVKEDIINSNEVPGFIRDSSRNAKVALNRDEDYVKKAKRRFKRLDSGREDIDDCQTNLKIIELCNKAISINKSNSEAYCLKAEALINLEDYDKAIEELINCLALTPDDLDIKLAIANANRLNRDFSDAIDVYDSVLKVDENCFEAFRGKALTFYDWEKYAQASECFKKANSIYLLDEEDLNIWEKCKN
jgi:tetratricopeptide (TPR) repeat protein